MVAGPARSRMLLAGADRYRSLGDPLLSLDRRVVARVRRDGRPWRICPKHRHTAAPGGGQHDRIRRDSEIVAERLGLRYRFVEASR